MDWNPAPDPLVVPQLPVGDESPDWCELCERANDLPRRWAIYETVRYLVILVLVASTAGFLPRYAEGTSFSGVPELWLMMLAVKLVCCFILYLTVSSRLRLWLGLTGAWILLGGLLRMQAEAENHVQGYFSIFVIAVGCSSWLAFLITHQFVFFTAANLKNEWHVADAWRLEWVGFTSGELPRHRSARHPSLSVEFNSLHGM